MNKTGNMGGKEPILAAFTCKQDLCQIGLI